MVLHCNENESEAIFQFKTPNLPHIRTGGERGTVGDIETFHFQLILIKI